jgi:transcription initiation factor TFIID subunit 5
MTSCTMSDDCTILAAGFAESYIRLWNLKGQPFQPMHSDFDPESVRTCACHVSRRLLLTTCGHTARQLKQLKQQTTSTTIKLVGHSGPVYALSFDPLEGPADAPRYLLSSSQDGTVRLWSLDTFTNVVVYKGHRDPVWDVDWSPKGVYFATASRDRTARIWCTDRTSPLRILAGHLADVDVSARCP